MTTTPLPDPNLSLTTEESGPHAVSIALVGDLAYDTSDVLLQRVNEVLDGRTELEALHLDCAGLGTVDSMGLSALLQVHRTAGGHGVRLHLDRRSTGLDRMLTITGTFEHLTNQPLVPVQRPAGEGAEPVPGA
ncbi:STAS domain-containing protein [Streptomyces sp. NPDC047108]|uniref:STAS domain-containing protein n=1 Tax=Streptomyces sp. NPDC047108 TaxID=3155025 RepID=UPI0033C9230A